MTLDPDESARRALRTALYRGLTALRDGIDTRDVARDLAVVCARLDREAAHVAGRVQLADQERGQRGGDEAGEEQRGEVVHGTETNR